MPQARDKVYLGDGAYAEQDASGMLLVYTSDGVQQDNKIYFEKEVWESLVQFVDGLKRENKF